MRRADPAAMATKASGKDALAALGRKLARAWARWKAFVQRVGNFQARILLSILYFTVVPPFALIVKAFRDPLSVKPPRGEGFWTDRPTPDTTLDSSRKQF